MPHVYDDMSEYITVFVFSAMNTTWPLTRSVCRMLSNQLDLCYSVVAGPQGCPRADKSQDRVVSFCASANNSRRRALCFRVVCPAVRCPSFIDELDTYPLEIYRMCKNERPTSGLSKVIVLQAANARI